MGIEKKSFFSRQPAKLFAVEYRTNYPGQKVIKGYCLLKIDLTFSAILLFGHYLAWIYKSNFIPFGIYFFWPVASSFIYILLLALNLVLFHLIHAFARKFEIIVDYHRVTIKSSYFGLVFYTISQRKDQVIIDEEGFRNLKSLSRNTYYSNGDLGRQLRFMYISGWEDTQDHVEIWYKNKKHYIFWFKSEKQLWELIKKAFIETEIA